MNSNTVLTVASTFLLPMSMLAQVGNMQAGADSQDAMRMVRAQGALVNTVDTDEATPGSQFSLKLSRTVELKDGTRLASGTILVGKVGQDDMQLNGTPKLALRFTEADLKDGRTIPIRATIVGFAPPEMIDTEGNYIEPGDQAENAWQQGIVGVHQIDALPHVDLHSSIASQDSGVFVSKNEKDVKLKAGSELEVAIEPSNMSGAGQAGGMQ